MREETLIFVLAFGEGALLLLLFLWMPVMSGRRAFFGVRVDEETMQGAGRSILRRYRLTVAALLVFVQACAYLLAVQFSLPLIAVLASFAALAVGMMTYHRFAWSVRPHAVPGVTTRFAAPLTARRLADFTSLPVELVVVAGTVLPFALLAYFYPELPDPIPVHFDFSGRPDGWAKKSLTKVFFLPALGAYMQVLFVVLKHDIAQAKLTLPADGAAEYLRGKERFLWLNISIADVARVSIALIFLCITLLLLTNTLPPLMMWRASADAALWLFMVLMLGGMAFLIWRAAAINRELQERFGDSYVQRPADEERWQDGLNYSNPDDPALMVEKLFGVGYTYNTAHPAFRTRLVLLAGVPFFVVWAVLSL